MADAVNRIVPSSVALDRASWQARKRQRKREKEGGAQSLQPDGPVTTGTSGSAEPAPKDSKFDKGKHLDVSV